MIQQVPETLTKIQTAIESPTMIQKVPESLTEIQTALDSPTMILTIPERPTEIPTELLQHHQRVLPRGKGSHQGEEPERRQPVSGKFDTKTSE
jgi:hypothetical protein